MFEVNDSFKKLALSHYGYDGGNLQSSFWISGIEWGGGIKAEELEHDIKKGPVVYARSTDLLSERLQYTKYNFDRVWLKILAKVLGHNISDFRKMIDEETKALTANGPMMKFNLYPISFKNTSSEQWNRDLYQLTGFPTKELYIAWVQTYRFKFFNDLVKQYSPKIVLCSGTTFKRDFLLAFGGIESLFATPLEKIQISESKDVLVYQSALSSNTKICIAPFFGSIHGTKSDEECNVLGSFLRSKL